MATVGPRGWLGIWRKQPAAVLHPAALQGRPNVHSLQGREEYRDQSLVWREECLQQHHPLHLCRRQQSLTGWGSPHSSELCTGLGTQVCAQVTGKGTKVSRAAGRCTQQRFYLDKLLERKGRRPEWEASEGQVRKQERRKAELRRPLSPTVTLGLGSCRSQGPAPRTTAW